MGRGTFDERERAFVKGGPKKRPSGLPGECHCLRCGHHWVPKQKTGPPAGLPFGLPVACAHCSSAYWNKLPTQRKKIHPLGPSTSRVDGRSILPPPDFSDLLYESHKPAEKLPPTVSEPESISEEIVEKEASDGSPGESVSGREVDSDGPRVLGEETPENSDGVGNGQERIEEGNGMVSGTGGGSVERQATDPAGNSIPRRNGRETEEGVGVVCGGPDRGGDGDALPGEDATE